MAEFVNLRFTFIIIKVKTCLPCSPHITKLNSKNKLKKQTPTTLSSSLSLWPLHPYLFDSLSLSLPIYSRFLLSLSVPKSTAVLYLCRRRRFISALLLLRLNCLDRCYSLGSVYTIVWVVRSFYFFYLSKSWLKVWCEILG